MKKRYLLPIFMTLNLRNFLTLVLVLVCELKYSHAQTAKEIAKNCIPSTVSLILEDNFKQPISLGSGFVIGNGQIITNLHVIEGAKFGNVFLVDSGSNKNL